MCPLLVEPEGFFVTSADPAAALLVASTPLTPADTDTGSAGAWAVLDLVLSSLRLGASTRNKSQLKGKKNDQICKCR